jgi:hypothetical protein
MRIAQLAGACLVAGSLAATAALAQAEMSTDLGMDWNDSMNSALFSDDTRATLRTDDEIRTSISGLTETDRQMLMTQCQERQAAASGSTTTTTTTDTTTTAPADSTASTTTTGDQTAAAGATMTPVSEENMTHICELVMAM